MKQILDSIAQVSVGHWFFYAFPAAFVLILILLRERRSQVIPLGILTLAVCNPLFYRIWNRLDLYAYWRMLWVVPVIPVFAAIPAAVFERMGKRRPVLKTAAALLCTAVFAFMGTFLYSGAGGQFTVPAENREKLPDGAKLIADYLLSLDDHPRVIADYNVSVYLRQYNGQIETLYGRDVEGYILSADGEIRKLDRQIRDPVGDLSAAAEIMLNDDYDYIVIRDYDRKDQLEELHFEMLAHYAGYGIYIVHGQPSVIKEKNALGQVIRKTYVDADGVPAVQEGGFTSVEYAYDGNGFLRREFYADADGHGIADRNGRAGYERVLDRKGRVLSEISLGPDGRAVATVSGYAEIRWAYQDGRICRESFFDESGRPVSTKAGYAEVRREYRGEECVRESYFDESGRPMTGPAGYASMEKKLDGKGRILSQTFYDETGNWVMADCGYAQVRNTWDGSGILAETSYLDPEGNPCVLETGHAGFRQAETPEGRMRTYVDAQGQTVVRSDGYAMVRWTKKDAGGTCLEFLDSQGQVISMEGINLVEQAEKSWSEWMRPRYQKENVNIHVGSVNLGNQKAGDVYTCQVEIEFLGVSGTEGKEFRFLPQGAQDGRWVTGNVWNGSLIRLEAPPEDGVYVLTSTQRVTEAMEGISTFDLDFRCDYWNSGAFRIRRVKIEKGDQGTAWTDGL